MQHRRYVGVTVRVCFTVWLIDWFGGGVEGGLPQREQKSSEAIEQARKEGGKEDGPMVWAEEKRLTPLADDTRPTQQHIHTSPSLRPFLFPSAGCASTSLRARVGMNGRTSGRFAFTPA
jgi:hypothetical protein